MGKAASRPEGPLPPSKRAFPHFTEFIEVAEGFWNLRADFQHTFNLEHFPFDEQTLSLSLCVVNGSHPKPTLTLTVTRTA